MSVRHRTVGDLGRRGRLFRLIVVKLGSGRVRGRRLRPSVAGRVRQTRRRTRPAAVRRRGHCQHGDDVFFVVGFRRGYCDPGNRFFRLRAGRCGRGHHRRRWQRRR